MLLSVWIVIVLGWCGRVFCITFTDDVITSYREKVRRMFYHAYNGYLDYAYPLDELKPLTCVGQDTWGSFSLSLVDALDTLLVMGNHTEFARAADLVLKSVRTDANVNVSVFETNIRVVGGLLTAHMFSGRVKGMKLDEGWPCSGPLLNLAEKMAERLLPAFNTVTGMPYGTVNLKYGVHKDETPITCTAGVGTFIVEFGTLSRLTGDPRYERAALRALEGLWNTRSPIGLVGNHINVQTGQWTATDSGIGAGIDSYYEYLVKGALLFQRPSLMQQFHVYASAINKHVRREDWFMWVTMQKGTVSLPIFQSLEAFWPGLLTLVGDIEDASRIMLQYSQLIQQYGFPPEFYNIPKAEPNDGRAAFPLRPEMAESLMYLYRATEDPMFLEIGAQLVDAIEYAAKTSCGYATVNNVNEHSQEDRMESFFLAETTKYLYLLFDHDNFLHNDGTTARIVKTPKGECVVDAGGYIYNTEAHPIDPGVVVCCSPQREQELETLRKWESQVNFISLLENHGMGKTYSVDRASLLPSEEDYARTADESKYVEKQYGTADIEYEVDESLLEESTEEDDKATPPPTPQPAEEPDDYVSSDSHQEEPERPDDLTKPVTEREEVFEEIRSVLRNAYLMDEEKRENGEKSNIAGKLLDNISKMYKEYADVILRANELAVLDVEEIQELLAKRAEVEAIPTVDAFCPDCCYPMELVGDSMALRELLNAIYSAHIYPKLNVSFEYGPLCRQTDEPRIEDSYRNEMPVLDSLKLPGDVPPSVFFHTPSFVNFLYEDISHLGFDLLTSPPLEFSSKFTGCGQGLETVRRDNSPLVAKVVATCLEKLLIERDEEGAVEYAKSMIRDLLLNKVDISMLVISKELTKSAKDSAMKQAHTELAEKMKKRDPGSAPRLGDRVPYVIICGVKGQQAYSRAEDPTYVLKNNVPIDTHHYLTNQLAKPLARIFEPILGDKAEKIFTEGEHTRVKTVVQSKVGGLSAFTKKSATCLGCKGVLKDQTAAVCPHCGPRLADIYLNKVNELNTFEFQFSRLWTECQNCAKSMHEEVSCSARDCPIFYMREKARGDLEEASKAIDRFGDPEW